MSDIFFIVLRRLRVPLILLISVYAIATMGMVLIPGVDPNGEPWHMSFFHAFYFVSFMGTTIGFGEIPYAFTDGQRAWVLVCIYTSVVSWLYGIGSTLRLLQDKTFQQAVAERTFKRSIKRIHLPFYIICGYGETGKLINRGLSKLDIQTVVIDLDEQRTSSIELENLQTTPIVLTADITEPQNLLAAGINHSHCKGVIAVTQNDHTNLQIAVASKLVNRRVRVICRSEIEDEADNMASFGTDSIINPYITFGRRLNLLAHNPALYRIQNWFINQHSAEHIHSRVTEAGLPQGKWIICGYGRFGKAIQKYVESEKVEVVIVDPDPKSQNAPFDTVIGRGTEAKTLQEAGIASASVIVAAGDDDANNLSILITAQLLNKEIYTIGRVSKEANQALFVHAKCDYIMRRSQVVANEVLTIISRPLVTKFIQYSSSLSGDATDQLISEICALTDNQDPITWRLVLNARHAPAFAQLLSAGRSLTIDEINFNHKLPHARGIPLLLNRGGMSHLLPSKDEPLQLDDELLLCGRRDIVLLAQRLRNNNELLDTLIRNNNHQMPLLRWLSRRNAK